MKNLKHNENLPKTNTEAQSVSQRNEVNEDPPAKIFSQGASSMKSLAGTLSKREKDDNHASETTGN